MQLVLYRNTSDVNVIRKNVTELGTLVGTLRGESSVMTPTVLVESDAAIVANYARIPDFGRYYHVTDVTSVRNGLWRLSMRCDPLMSFADGILALPVIAASAQADDSRYMPGPQWATTVKTKTDVVPFPSGLLDTGEYILITSGGIAGSQGGA
jgi:hypothetical protein